MWGWGWARPGSLGREIWQDDSSHKRDILEWKPAGGDQERARRTRELLIHALLELIETGHYDQISVQHIVVQAEVGCSTYYAYYENKDAQLMGGF